MQEAFIKVKNLFARSILLRRPDYNKEYTVYRDASKNEDYLCINTGERRWRMQGNRNCQ